MKKLTFFFLSLMLLLGMGTASAQTSPQAPIFTPNGGEVEADDEITIETATQGAQIYYGEKASFVNYTTEEELVRELDADVVKLYSKGAKPSLSDFGAETPGSKVSLSAAAALIVDGTIVWSEVTTREFTVKAGEEPVVEVAAPVITPATDAEVHMGDLVTIECATEGAEIYYTTNGSTPYTIDAEGYPVALKEGDTVFKYTEPFPLTEDMLIKQGTVWALKIRAVAVKGDAISHGGSAGLNVLPNEPVFSVLSGAVRAGKKVGMACQPRVADIYYTTDGSTPTMENSPKYTAPIEITEDVTIKAIAVLGQYQSSEVAVFYTIKTGEDPNEVILTFNPSDGAEVAEGTAVTVVANKDVEIFYMMFGSEAEAYATEWDQEKAESYNEEMKPVVSAEKKTIKAAYARQGAEAIAYEFFYATYTIKGQQPAITLTFNPASGSEVENHTTVTVTASREVEIFYNLYADKVAADTDKLFMVNAMEVTEDGMPVIAKDSTYLRCAIYDKGEMKYFDATYTIKEEGGNGNGDDDNTANEGKELAGVSIYPNPNSGVFYVELPVAATVEVFASNGVMIRNFTTNAGKASLSLDHSGIYFVRITGEGLATVKRVIVR